MIRSILFLIASAISLILVIPVMIISTIFFRRAPGKYPPAVTTAIVRALLRFPLWVAGAKYDVRGKENLPAATDEPVMFALNHQGDFDVAVPVLHLGVIPATLAKKQALKVPIANYVMMFMGCIFMDRGNVKQSLKCLKQAQDELEAGRSVCIYPEGTRSKGPDMGEFKHGSFRCAYKAHKQVIPVALDGSYKLFEAQKKLKAGTIKVSILPPVNSDDFENTAHLAEHVQGLIQAELDRMRAE
jgi:1-acyl-sn-glycerol-3-phosphate acyltransferase